MFLTSPRTSDGLDFRFVVLTLYNFDFMQVSGAKKQEQKETQKHNYEYQDKSQRHFFKQLRRKKLFSSAKSKMQVV
jgi:hypothetical protein